MAARMASGFSWSGAERMHASEEPARQLAAAFVDPDTPGRVRVEMRAAPSSASTGEGRTRGAAREQLAFRGAGGSSEASGGHRQLQHRLPANGALSTWGRDSRTLDRPVSDLAATSAPPRAHTRRLGSAAGRRRRGLGRVRASTGDGQQLWQAQVRTTADLQAPIPCSTPARLCTRPTQLPPCAAARLCAVRRIQTSARATDELQIRAMGFLEGYLTAVPIWEH